MKTAFLLRLLPLLLGIGFAPMARALPLTAAQRQTVPGHVPEAVANLQPVGRLDGSQHLKLAIGLSSRDEAGLDAFIHDVSDPASPNFRRYLTPAQFTDRFGPSQQDYNALMDFAKANGLNVTRQYSNRVVLDVEGAVADIEKALHVNLRTYQHPNEARTFYAPDVEPSLAFGASVLHVGGLDNYTLRHPKHVHHAVGRNAKATPKGSAPDGGLWGNDFRDAYAPDTTLTGSGQNVGLLEFEGYYPVDITDYEDAIGMNATNRPKLVVVPLDGGATPADGGDNGEECSIDIEMALSIAPGLSTIYVFEDGSSASGNAPFDDVFESMVTYTNVLQFSCSWGGNATVDPTSEVLFKEMAAQGQSFYDASGDNAAFVGAITFPSDSPSITQVGGTTLADGDGPSYAWVGEVVWAPETGPNVNANNAEGSSGGISTFYDIPSWQSGISMKANLGSTTKRNTPDVAANADNCYIYSDDGQPSGGWGGTSCAAPLWAGFTALLNEQAKDSGEAAVGFLNPALYALASGTNYANCFHDITSGNNTWTKSPSRFYAVTGYDLCTGLGTMTGTNLINALVPPNHLPRMVAGLVPYTLTTNEPCSNGVVNPGETVTVNFALQNAGTAATTNLVATLLTGNGVVFPSGPQTIGALSAGASITNAFSFFADGACGETIVAALQLQDGTNDLGTVSYSFLLGLSFSDTNFTENFDGVTAPAFPPDWTVSKSETDLTDWATESTNFDTSPNAVWCPDSPSVGAVYLVSPAILLSAGSNQLSFQNDFNLEDTYDGGVLEISIAGGDFTDILTAGGSFVTNGYNGTITDVGDEGSQVSPLNGRAAWTGDSGGFMTTTVSLPASASGTNIQIRWTCGTDGGNAELVGAGGWWIDTISISQPGFNCTNCPVTNVSAPTIFSPTNGQQITTISSELEVTGLAPADSTVTISNNSVSNVTVTADGNGVYAATAALGFGTNTLTATVDTSNSSSSVVVVLMLGPPALSVPSLTTTNVIVSGTGAAGATVDLYKGDSATGTPLTNFVVGSSGSFSVEVILPLGNQTLTATEEIGNQISSNTPPVSFDVVAQPAPTIVLPTNGTVLTKFSVSISGKGEAGAAVTIYDDTGIATNKLAKTTVSHAGTFSATGTLAEGVNTLFAIQGSNSPSSAAVVVNVDLSPAILVQPENQTNFLKGSVTFKAAVAGAAPLHLFWEANGAKISGANSSTYTLSNLKTSDEDNTYTLVASNKYGVATSAGVTVTLVPNPFTNLAGDYYGLFAETNAQFESSGLLTLDLTSMGKFTARMLCAGGSYSFAGALSGVGWESNTISRGTALPPLAVVLDMNTTNGMEQILGTVSAGTNWSASLEADLSTFSKTNEFTNAGKYTLIFGDTNSGAQSPGGDGYGTVSVSAAGMVSLSGVLSDNTSVAPAAAGISKYGRWPLYIPLYGKYGSLVGWIDFTNTGAGSFTGTNAMWFRTNADGKLYVHGFTNSLTIAGSTFAESNNVALMDLTNLQVFLSGGNLTDVLSNGVTLLNNGKFTLGGTGITGLTLSLTPGTGVIKGSFTDPATSASGTIKGVVFQQQTNADGFFISGTNSGSFLLTPP